VNITIILQSLNIAIFAAIALAIPYQGFVGWWFGGLFMLLVQAPMFVMLLILQLKKIKASKITT